MEDAKEYPHKAIPKVRRNPKKSANTTQNPNLQESDKKQARINMMTKSTQLSGKLKKFINKT